MAGGPSAAIRSECPLATEQYDGLMSAQDKAKLASLSGTNVAFQYAVQAGDNDDFFVTIPAGKQPPNGNYNVAMSIQSGTIFTLHRIPFANQAATQFRVLTDGTFAVGTLLGFTITAL